MTRFKATFAVLFALVVAACYPPTTSHPIGTTTPQKPDGALAGTWAGTDDHGKRGYFHFLRQDDGSFAVLIVTGADKSGDWLQVTATSVRLAGRSFLNARLVASNGKPENGAPAGTVPVLYRIDAHGTLTLAMMDEAKVKAAIGDGKIKGTVEKGQFGDAVVTADPNALDALFATPDAVTLFAKPFFTLHKVQ